MGPKHKAGLAAGVCTISLVAALTATAPIQAAGPVIIKGTSGNDFVIMARKGRKILAVGGVRGSEYTCWTGRIYWDSQYDGWAISMIAPNIYGGKPKYFRDTWYTVGNYRSSGWNLSRFYSSELTGNDYRMLRDCHNEIRDAGLLPRGL